MAAGTHLATLRLLFVSGVDWWETRQRFQHIAERLERDFTVTVVAPLHWRRTIAARRWKDLVSTAGHRQGLERQLVIEVPNIPFYRKLDLLVAANCRWFARATRHAVGARAFDVLWLTHPWQRPILDRIPHRCAVYDCVDEHAEFWAHRPGVARRIARLEAELVASADVIFASSPVLHERLREWRDDVVLARNGVEFERFQTGAAAGPVPDDVPTGQVVGFYGAIDRWVDLDLLAQASAALPECQFMLLGPVFVPLGALASRPNVHVLGPRPYHHLPDYLRATPVWLLPFRLNRLTRGVDPLKVYEYLAARRRVVATPLPALADVSPYLLLARDAAQAVEAICQALALGPLPPDPQLERLVAGRSWDRVGMLCADRLRSKLSEVAS